MTKKLRRQIIGILATVVVLCTGLLLLPRANKTYADGESEDFSFTSGAYSSYEFLNDEDDVYNGWVMAFELNKITAKFESLSTAPGGWWWWDETPYFEYAFTFYRKDGEKDVKLYRYWVRIEGDKDSSDYAVYTKKEKYVHYSEELGFANSESERLKDVTLSSEAIPDGASEYTSGGTYIASAFRNGKVNIPFDSNNKLKIMVIPNNPYTEYFVKFDYALKIWSSDSVGRDEVKISGSVQSPVRSLYTIFSNMDAAGALRTNISNDEAYNYAYNTIYNKVEKTVAITYLERIPDTPFATSKTQQATVTVNKDDPTLPLDEASRAIGVNNFDCLGSYCNSFETDSDNRYHAVYNNNVWLKARTVDGNDYDYFLNINKSYEEFYKYFVNIGVLEQGAYETVFSSQIYGNYSEQLSGYSPSTVYGYFGFAMIPKTYGINALWKEFFNTETSQSGVVSTIEYGIDLSLSAYNNLLKDYDYRFLFRVWNDAANFFTSGSEDATCYILYAEPGTKTSFVAENGADDINDDSGAAQQPIDDITSAIGNIGGSIVDGISGIGSWFSNLSNKTKTISTLVIIGLAFAVVLVINNNSRKNK